MMGCNGCKYYTFDEGDEPCATCKKFAKWEPVKEITELIEAAERKAFQAGWEGANELCEIGGIHDYVPEDFEKWKESK